MSRCTKPANLPVATLVMATVTFTLPQIASAIYCHRPDFDCYGNDIRANYDGNSSDCMSACDGEPRCRAFQANTRRQKCYLKTKACLNGELKLAVGANDYFWYDGSDCKDARTKYTCFRWNDLVMNARLDAHDVSTPLITMAVLAFLCLVSNVLVLLLSAKGQSVHHSLFRIAVLIDSVLLVTMECSVFNLENVVGNALTTDFLRYFFWPLRMVYSICKKGAVCMLLLITLEQYFKSSCKGLFDNFFSKSRVLMVSATAVVCSVSLVMVTKWPLEIKIRSVSTIETYYSRSMSFVHADGSDGDNLNQHFKYPLLPNNTFFMFNSIYFMDHIDLVVEFILPFPIIIAIAMALTRNLAKIEAKEEKKDKLDMKRTIILTASFVILMLPLYCLSSMFIVNFPYCIHSISARSFEQAYFVVGFAMPIVSAGRNLVVYSATRPT